MSRVKRGPATHKRRKRKLKQAKGYRGGRSKLYKTATEKVAKALQYAHRDRRQKKRDYRALWITRIGIAAKLNGLSYSKLISGLKKAQIAIDRKILSELACRSPNVFKEIVEQARAKL